MRTTRSLARFGLLGVAMIVAVGCGGGGDDGAAAERSNDLTIEAGDLFFEPEEFAAGPGTVNFTLDNVGSSEHDLVIEELGDTEVIGLVAPGESGTGSADLEEGTYTLYCSVAGHREAGMEATLDVG